MNPLVTVLIDSYNYGRFIEKAIESVIAQDFPAEAREILVVDDGSADDTPERIQRFGEQIRYLRKANGGQASAFNFGFAHSRGEIVTFLDADDYWLPGKLRRVIDEFRSDSGVGMVHHRLREVNELTGESHDGAFIAMSGNLAQSRSSILNFNPTPSSSVAFRRTVLERILPMPEDIRIQADGYIQTLALFLAPIQAVDECLAVYRIHGENLYFLMHDSERDRVRRQLRAETLRALVAGLRDWFRAHGYAEENETVAATLGLWNTRLDREEFAIRRPGRLRFFRHLLEANRNRYPVMSVRLRVINYFDAAAALLLGYDNFWVLDYSREKLFRWVRGEL